MDFSSTDTTKPTSPAQVSYSDTAFGTAVAGKQIERRRNLSMIAMDLKAIWEISAKTIRERGSGIGESEMSNIAVTTEDFVSLIEMRRPPHNFFDVAMLRDIADALDALEARQDRESVMDTLQPLAFRYLKVSFPVSCRSKFLD